MILEVFDASSGVYNLVAASIAWHESSATWANVNPLANSGLQIGDFLPSSTGSYLINLNTTGLALLQSWVDDAENNGIFIITGGTNNGTDIRSSEYDTAKQRPKLSVTYTLPSHAVLDITGEGSVDALSDGLLLLRYLFGFRGETLVNEVVAIDASRSHAEIENYLQMLATH